MQNKIILFLDFDGVPHPTSGYHPFKPECMDILSSIIFEHPIIDIVVTSSWREEKKLDELKNLLGYEIVARVIGVTPIIDDPFLHHVRYHEVICYLKFCSHENWPWLAIDDELGNYPPTAPVIITDRTKGLKKKCYKNYKLIASLT